MQESPATGSPLAILADLGRQLTGTYRLTVAAQQLARALDRALAPDRMAIVLQEWEGTPPSVPFCRDYPGASIEDPLIRLAMRQGPLVVPHATPGRLAELGGAAPWPCGAWLGVPIVLRDEPVGAVSAVSDTVGRFDADDLDFAVAAASQLAVTLETGRLIALLAHGKREWEQMVDAIGQAFCAVDKDGAIRRANRAFSIVAHVPVTALAGRHWLSVLPAEWAEPVARALARPQAGGTHELRIGDRIYSITALPLPEPEGGAVLVLDDQTDKRRLQEQLVQSEKMSAIGQLIAGVAHDLNNPLASVVGFADYLVEEGRAPDDLKEPLEAIRQEAERAAGIVHNLLNFARKQETQRHPQDMGAILESTLALLRNELMASKLDAELHIAPELPPVEVDRTQMQQVFVNLLTNALQAMRSSGRGTRISVRADRWLDGIAVTVSDDGPGIPGEIRERVFEPFFTTKAEGGGTGLGLSISQGIIKEHGGRIVYQPAPDGGASFRVELPGGAGGAAPDEPTVREAPNLRILVVDDEPHILHYMVATLEAWGHAVEVAHDGRAALKAVNAAPFDVIITDLRMAEVGGREFYDALVRERPELARRVVFATGDTVREDVVLFLETTGRPLLRKPFTLKELRSVLALSGTSPRFPPPPLSRLPQS
jgi:two-component system NtrC family sensor kinase